jgi:hypothetical protein
MAQRTCTVPECPKPHNARGYCAPHYAKWKKYGDPLAGRTYTKGWAEAIERYTRTDGDCIIWIGARSRHGYGNYGHGGSSKLAHRVAWAEAGRPLDAETDLDHACRNRACINVDHLRPATQALNMQNQAADGRGGRSQYRGVYWHEANQKWVAQVRHNGRSHYLGQYESEEAAMIAARDKRNELYVYNDQDRMEA